jgi:hypothetical protein
LLGRGEKTPQNIPVEIAGIQDEILTRDFRSSEKEFSSLDVRSRNVFTCTLMKDVRT